MGRHKILGNDGELLVIFSDKKEAQKAVKKTKLILKEDNYEEDQIDPDLLIENNQEEESK
ncbi:MAG: hypothetical protein ACK4IX_16510 [Candidatus Sericytochromatia bacterium]